ncbi:hypothetical protein DPMN_124176 [Dreissena polymorpha]|uniref:Uncharacterized protein n=1 Tax=Dreissena polymorpha TaxID=45954 RepID=A0A9D4GT03_DREPO|nr:hypothetical protein DPMN_124176 [Dreissena polymorpha]
MHVPHTHLIPHSHLPVPHTPLHPTSTATCLLPIPLPYSHLPVRHTPPYPNLPQPLACSPYPTLPQPPTATCLFPIPHPIPTSHSHLPVPPYPNLITSIFNIIQNLS